MLYIIYTMLFANRCDWTELFKKFWTE